MSGYNVAVVGATGLIGGTFLTVLEDRGFPVSRLTALASARSAGKTVKFRGEDVVVEELTETSFDRGIDFAFFSAGGDTSGRFAPFAAKAGAVVIDNSSRWRMEADVPLVVPEVNPEDALQHKGIIANPNCSTIPAVVALKPLALAFGLRRVVYSTYQSVSGAGQGGCDDLEATRKGEAPKKFPHPIANNCIPHIDVFTESGYTKEELKMRDETRKILRLPSLRVTTTCVRVPVYVGHSVCINAEFENPYEISRVYELLSQAPGVILQDDTKNNIYPLAKNAVGRDEVFVGRIRRDESAENALNMWVVADNARKGAATNAIQIAEYLISHRG